MDTARACLNTNRCKGCALCVDSCPKKILSMSNKLNTNGYCVVEVVDKSKCTACGFCAMMCPDLAIEILK